MSGIGPATLVILAINVALGAYTLFVNQALIGKLLFRPYDFARGRNRITALTSGFVHADLGHLLFNMITFWFFGRPLELRIGTPAFVLLYFLGLAFSLLGTFRKHRNDPQYATLGASGAISAVLFAAIVYFPTMSLIILPIPVPIPAPLFGIGYLAYSFWSARRDRGRINHDAHFGGALVGLVFVALTNPGAYLQALDMLRR
jgi:membrane associated rhomboid family serine protease